MDFVATDFSEAMYMVAQRVPPHLHPQNSILGYPETTKQTGVNFESRLEERKNQITARERIENLNDLQNTILFDEPERNHCRRKFTRVITAQMRVGEAVKQAKPRKYEINLFDAPDHPQSHSFTEIQVQIEDLTA